MTMRSFCEKLGSTFLSGVVLCAVAPGCDSGSSLEKPAPAVDLKPDMNKMPGYNDMQKDLAKKGVKSPAPEK
jgi:hypothetical protein